MVGFKGQFGVWTDNETQGVSGSTNQIRSPGLWTGTDYYDPALARKLSRQTYLATQNLQGDAALANLYAADPNPLGHTVGNVLAGVGGGILGGPTGSAVAVGAWETLYGTALGEPLDTALTQGVVAGITDFAFGKAFEAGAAVVGAGFRAARGGVTRVLASSATDTVSRIVATDAVTITLTHEAGTSSFEFLKKANALQQLGEEGVLFRAANPVARDRTITAAYKSSIIRRIYDQYNAVNPEFAEQLIARVRRMQPDHVHELQLGGSDVASNLRMLDARINHNIGVQQIRPQIRNLPVGTPIRVRVVR